jgi:glycosyltransferase involved in cell wall biosynthesis
MEARATGNPEAPKMPPSFKDYAERKTTRHWQFGNRRKSARKHPVGSKLVTVITVAFNSANTIERTMDSIAAQTYPCIEYLVVDGGSTDGTVTILNTRREDMDAWISEPDRGISDAFNKGIAMAGGEYIALVNSDDWLESSHVATAVEALQRTGADFVYGDLVLHPSNSQSAYMLAGDRDYVDHLPHTMPQINHPSVVCRRTVYERYGLFDTTLTAAMDFEWLVRGHQQHIVGVYVPDMRSHMSMEGVSHRNFMRGLKEVRDVSIRYGYPRYLAQARFLFRGARVRTRLALQGLVPRKLYEWLRHTINPHYRKVGI